MDASSESGASAAKVVDTLIGGSGVTFGTSGARGLDTSFTDDVCAACIHAFLDVIRTTWRFDRVLVGMDLRPSSPRIAAACAKACRQPGLGVEFCNVLPTPALALRALAARAPAVMVSGSHIPFDWNGLKFYRPDGEISKEDEQAILAVRGSLPLGVAHEALPSPDSVATEAYIQRYLDFFPPDMLSDWRIGLYEHSSASRDLFDHIFRALGADVVSFGRTDAFVPIDTEAVSAEDAARAREWATTHSLDVIISTDGDGDRPLIADEQGHWLRGDLVGLLCARHLGIDAIAVPVSCNTALEASNSFAKVCRTRIGSPHVITAMQALVCDGRASVAGFEANGGFLLESPVERDGRTLEPLPTRDAALPALALLAAARERGTCVSGLLDGLPRRFTTSGHVAEFPTARSQALLARWSNDVASMACEFELPAGPSGQADLTDGLRLHLVDGDIVHLRPSGNAPEFRCYCESGSEEGAEGLLRSVLGRLELLKETG